MTTIQALQAKAEEVLGKDLSQREKSENENESDSEDGISNESSGRDDNCAGNADENDVSTSECISTRHVFFYTDGKIEHDWRGKCRKTMSLNHNC